MRRHKFLEYNSFSKLYFYFVWTLKSRAEGQSTELQLFYTKYLYNISLMEKEDYAKNSNLDNYAKLV